MIENLNKYKELLQELEEEKRLLKNLEDIAEESQKEFLSNEENIIKLNQEIEKIRKHINDIITLKLQKVNNYLKIPYTIILITVISITSILSSFDIGIIFLGIISSILGYYGINHIISNILTKRYKRKNKTILELQKEITQKETKLFKLRKDKTLIFNNKVNNRINYNNQRHKVLELEKQINEVKIDYATPIFNEELNRLSDNKPLTRIRSPQK